jgi:succinoglycan biosynthesis transport protein ExoP
MTEPRALPAPNQALQPSWYGYDVEPPEQSAVPLAHYLWILRRHRWKILAFVFACVTATLIVSARLTPIYESTVTVDIDRQMPSAIIGQDAARAPLNDADQFLATQVKLIQSDSVLRPVAQQYRLLDLEKDASDVTPEKPSEAEEDAPILLKKLKVTRPPNTYLLLISYRSPQPRLAADVANAVAHSYVEHTYNIRFQSSASLADFMEKQLEELKAKMERSSAALAQFERELNVINPEEKTSILSARLLQLNTEYTNAQTDRVRKESAWKSVQSGIARSRPGLDAGREPEDALRQAGRSPPEVRRHQDALRPKPSRVPQGRGAGGGDRAPVAAKQQERGATGGSGVPRIHEPREHAAESRSRDQGGVRPAERPQLRIPDLETGGRRRQVAL